ncbi:uncharacterized protein K489DRAFT_389591 [Dissoconium aciculare CBS 342.82]|uniref:Uncharacterized protein n=1 Tax=Dissoconium aciculare CBS 342.82 TaxID=1314786 RepID=A0A6J3M166_9PEZI|nr:uncharacterized protein K489DRAFT_389591 [Dissoconium aciculare CBS 342.82]KAF1821775.1 hypothetical protein K489DRAFT_389591 [Dissoconium aciculare CBS 342.82]
MAENLTDLILRAFSPHVSVLASADTEELIRHKGINGGLLELLRPFGEHVQGKVTVRDSGGVSRSWEDFSVRFIGAKDGLEPPRSGDRRTRLRTGGDVPQIEELVERHLTFSEESSGPVEVDYINSQDAVVADPNAISPFYALYIRRLLSGLPMVPSETFSHPVAAVIAISSRSPAPIEELRSLYDSSNSGDRRLPQWVHNEFLRYYVLIHDEDYDDITKSMALYDQMKRHFGLHCHLLRLRSTQSVPSDDDSIKLPNCEWISASEELSEIVRREADEDDEDPTPYIFESDASALRAFVREMVTQSIIPAMERASATWNDQVASRRRGLSGRFITLSKRFTGFSSRAANVPALSGGGNNYDSLQGFYRPDAPEAIMRKLADYAMMIRDFKLAQSVYEILVQDFKSDKAWRHLAAANEMAAVSTLLALTGNLSSKVRIETIDSYIETAYYSYLNRVTAPYNALRTLILSLELLRLRGGSAVDDAARWSNKILDDRLVGPIGHVLIMERIATCFAERKGVGALQSGNRQRKAAFWNLLATDAWLQLGKAAQAEKRLAEARRLYARTANNAAKGAEQHSTTPTRDPLLDEPIQEDTEQLGPPSPTATITAAYRRSLLGAAPQAPLLQQPQPPRPPPPPSVPSSLDPLGVIANASADGSAPLPPPASSTASPSKEKRDPRAEGFE